MPSPVGSVAIVLSVLLASSVSAGETSGAGLEIYHVAHKDAPNALRSAADLHLPERPLVFFRDISGYDWKTHEIFLSAEALARFASQPIALKDLFVVALDGKPIYFGYFWTVLFSERAERPIIHLSVLREKKRLIIRNESSAAIGERKNDLIFRTLVQAGKLR
jgi:hypothetical protein